ncbi:hypothetical protein PROFUN_08687 [Planoprotostelium fungivorum]|uniref:Uncharacterized protein n=1 Tax=Planoprotostelium fungivorum TaxID=1890364 RepID=A0A2P6MQT1_9EUKA|nr:hypothetical protein PROFUN_08687 [Planoprotostelium fungivorum]
MGEKTEESPFKLLAADDERRRLALPYITKFRLDLHEKLVEDELYTDIREDFLQAIAKRENNRVDFYLNLLGRAEMEEELAHFIERERELETTKHSARGERSAAALARAALVADPEISLADLISASERPKSRAKSWSEVRIEHRNVSVVTVSQRDTPGTSRPVTSRLRKSKVCSPDDPEETKHKSMLAKWARSMARELEKKIEDLRRDPIKRSLLEDRIARYRNRRLNIESTKNLVEENKRTVFRASTPDVRLRRIKAFNSEQEEKSKKVMDRKKVIDENTAQRRWNVIHKREIQAQKAKRDLAVETERQALMTRQKTWMVYIALAARIQMISTTVENLSAIIIQKAYVSHKRRNEGRVWRAKMIIVLRQLARWITKFRCRRKRKAAEVGRSDAMTADDEQDVNRIVSVVKRFRFQGRPLTIPFDSHFVVRQSQTYWRKFQAIRAAQTTLLRLQWQSTEEELHSALRSKMESEARRDELMKNALHYSPPQNRKRAPMGDGMVASRVPKGIAPALPVSDQNEKPSHQKATPLILKVPDSIRDKLLADHLRVRHRDNSIKMVAYSRATARAEKSAQMMLPTSILPGDDISRDSPRSDTSSRGRSRPGTALSASEFSINLPERQSEFVDVIPEFIENEYRSQPSSCHRATPPQDSRRGTKRVTTAKILKPSHPGLFHPLIAKIEMLKLIDAGSKEAELLLAQVKAEHGLQPSDPLELDEIESDDELDMNELEENFKREARVLTPSKSFSSIVTRSQTPTSSMVRNSIQHSNHH